MVNLTIDGRAIQAKPGSTILEVAKENGIFIPYLCYHPALETHRLLPHLRGGREARTAPAHAGLRHLRHRGHGGGDQYAERVLALRQELMKLVLINHALECPICDKGGECELQDLTHALGVRTVDLEAVKLPPKSGLRLPDGGAPPGPLRHLRPLRARLPGPGGGHGHQLHDCGATSPSWPAAPSPWIANSAAPASTSARWGP